MGQWIIIIILLNQSLHAGHIDFQERFEKLTSTFSTYIGNIQEEVVHVHTLKEVTFDGCFISLDDGMVFAVNWWHRSNARHWRKGDLICINFDASENEFKLDNRTLHSTIWTSIQKPPSCHIHIQSFSGEAVILTNGDTFKPLDIATINKWNTTDNIVIFGNSPGICQLWNLEKGVIARCKFIGREFSHIHEVILGLEEKLNQKVFQQKEAAKAVADALFIYYAGLKEKESPAGVFLFLGPTGVGKTELAKTLSKELYNDFSSLLRFDMSHFAESHALARLLGAPPGYVNHEDGGQLTEPLIMDSKRVVLLDEIEKAHPSVRKVFLPVFDEGFILDNTNRKVDCVDTIFIMTSNLCSSEIAELCTLGYRTDEILSLIETKLMEELSPELYNRLQPVLFHSLKKETMGSLVDMLLSQFINKLFNEHKIQIQIDESLRTYLIEKGYHPLLGARPLKKLIEKRVLTCVAYNIIKQEISKGAKVILLYEPKTDSVVSLQVLSEK